jgi:hypothetical protein
MKITTEMIQAVYSKSVAVYHREINKQQAITDLKDKFGMNKSSASFYIKTFKNMMDGEKYNKTINEEATDYFFTHILNDYGVVKLGNAIKAATKHIEYQVGKNNLSGIRDIISRHETSLGKPN